MKDEVTDMEKLRAVALDQHGYVTSAQALEAGVSYPSLTYFVKNGRLERPERGIYRIPQVPYTEHDGKELALLWASPDNAVLGYETALDAYGVCDINPMKVHVVVPKGARINKAGGHAYIVHKRNLGSGDVGWWEGMPVVKLPIAISQCIESGVPSYLIEQAIERGFARGILAADEKLDLLKQLEERQ